MKQTTNSSSEHQLTNNQLPTIEVSHTNVSHNGVDPTFQTSISPDEAIYKSTEAEFKVFISDLPSFVAQKLAEKEKELKQKIEMFMNDIEKFKMDKEQHAKNLQKIRNEFDERYSLQEIRQANMQFRQSEVKTAKEIEEKQHEIDMKMRDIGKKKELVQKYMQIVKTRAKRNVRLTTIANKLQYEIEKRKKEKQSAQTTNQGLRNFSEKTKEKGPESLPKLRKRDEKTSKSHAEDKNKHGLSSFKNQGIHSNSSTNKFSANQHKQYHHSSIIPPRISRTDKEVKEMLRKINRVLLKDMDIFNLFRDCLTSYFAYVKKTQQITQQDGLQGSLLFEIMQKSSQGKIGYPHLGESTKAGKMMQGYLQDRHIVNVVYEGVKSEKLKRKNQLTQKTRKFKITWEELKNFNPLQVMGLLVMQWSVLGDVLIEWENLLSKKSKLIRSQRSAKK